MRDSARRHRRQVAPVLFLSGALAWSANGCAGGGELAPPDATVAAATARAAPTTPAVVIVTKRDSQHEYREVLQCGADNGGRPDGSCAVPLTCDDPVEEDGFGLTYAVSRRLIADGRDSAWEATGTICRSHRDAATR